MDPYGASQEAGILGPENCGFNSLLPLLREVKRLAKAM
jgi:hypothetical protein